MSDLDLARRFDEGWKKGYQAAAEHPFKCAQTEVEYLRLRLQKAEAIIRCIHLDFSKEAWEDAHEYMRQYGLTDSGAPA
jgi:hypothetical protein